MMNTNDHKIAKLLLLGCTCDNCTNFSCLDREFEKEYTCIAWIEESNLDITEIFEMTQLFEKIVGEKNNEL